MLKVASEVDWRFRLALILANETGHRIRAIRRLRWSDIDISEELIRWRATEDKSGHDHLTPIRPEALGALKRARAHRPAVGGCVALSSAGGWLRTLLSASLP